MDSTSTPVLIVLVFLVLMAVLLVIYLTSRNKNVSGRLKTGMFEGELTTSDAAKDNGAKGAGGGSVTTEVGNVTNSTLSNAAQGGNAKLTAKDVTDSHLTNTAGGGNAITKAGNIIGSTVVNANGNVNIHMPGAVATPEVKLDTHDIAVNDALEEYFSIEDINGLCFNLGIDDQEIKGDTKSVRARELVKYCKHNNLLGRLVSAMKKERNFLKL